MAWGEMGQAGAEKKGYGEGYEEGLGEGLGLEVLVQLRSSKNGRAVQGGRVVRTEQGWKMGPWGRAWAREWHLGLNRC